jgi:hypothetical protein
MFNRKFPRLVLGMALCTALCALLAEAPRAVAADRPVVKKVRTGRLPKYYKDVVSQKQRDKIYEIQGEYKPKIDVLKAQLDALNKEMNEKIASVLTAEQKKKIDDAAATKATRAKADQPAEAAKPADAANSSKTTKKGETTKKVEKQRTN